MIKHTRRCIHSRLRFALLVTTAYSVTACGPSDKEGRQPLNAAVPQAGTPTDADASATTLPSGAVAALDAGNGAYRSKDFATALKKYREAADIAPAHAAPWFGLYMVASELKNVSLADSAMLRVKLLSADPAALGAHAEVAAEGDKQGGTPGAIPPRSSYHPDIRRPENLRRQNHRCNPRTEPCSRRRCCGPLLARRHVQSESHSMASGRVTGHVFRKDRCIAA